ncbi:MAG: SulP family inorganic anion transporter [Hyphomicrobium sp.]
MSDIAAPNQGKAASTIGSDLLASIVVFLVALPLCMGIALASGMPPTSGIITGIIGGLVVGLISGSPLQVSGPAAGLAVLVYQFVKDFGPEMLGTIVLFAGVLQFIAGQLKLGQWFRAVSPAVIHGMLAGIGVLIFAAQFHVMLDGQPIGTGIQNLLGIPGAIRDAISAGDSRLNAGEIGVLTIASIACWAAFAPKSLRLIPAPLVGVLVGVLAAAVFKLDNVKFVSVPENFWSTVVFPTPERITRVFTDAQLLISAAAIAFIASAETLLCATAVDQMHSGVRTKYDRELSAQGIGNAICGTLGVLPMTGVIVRSGANVEAGGKTRLSTIFHGLWLLLFSSVMPWTLTYVPLSALAAILVYTGYKLAYPKAIPTLLKYGYAKVFIYVATVVMIVSTDLLKGVLTGLALSLARTFYALSRLNIRKEYDPASNRIDVYLDGTATLIRLPRLARELETMPAGSQVRVHIKDLEYIDHACLDLMSSWDKQHRATGGSLTIEWDDLAKKYHERHGTGLKSDKPASKATSSPA